MSLDLFDTLTHIMGYAQSQEVFDTFADIIYSELQRLNQLFDAFNEYPNINNIKTINNNAGIKPVEVHPDLLDMIKAGINAYHITHGTVNIAIGPVTAIWRVFIKADEAQLPDMDALFTANQLTNITNIIIDEPNNTVFLSHTGMMLDVGSLGKGFAIERATQKAIEAGFSSFVLSVGGDIRTANAPPVGERPAWLVGIQHPNQPDEIIDTLLINNDAVFTSGDYLRYFMYEGTRYHHIIDPNTLMPANTASSATVIHPCATLAEILSLAVFILDIDTAKGLLAQHNAEAMWVLPDGTVVATEGYGRFR
jgi:thiamine biosynthesis lipoprotein